MRLLFFLIAIIFPVIAAFGQDEAVKTTNHQDKIGEEILKLRALGRTHIENLEYQEAEKYLTQAVGILRTQNLKSIKFKIHSESVFECMNELARYYSLIGKNDEAQDLLKESDSLSTLKFRKTSVYRWLAKVELGNSYLADENIDMAQRVFLEALNGLNGVTSNGRLFDLYQTCHVGLASINLQLGNIKEAWFYTNRALGAKVNIDNFEKLIRNLIRPDSKYAFAAKINPAVLNMIGQLFLATEKIDYAQTINSLGLLLAPDASPEIHRAMLKTKVAILLHQQDFMGCYNTMDELLVNYITDIQKNFYALSEREKEAYFQRLSQDFEFYASLALLNQIDSLQNRMVSNLLNFQLNTKGLILDEALRQRNLLRSLKDDMAHQQFDEVIRVKTALSNLAYKAKSSELLRLKLEERIDSLEKKLAIQLGNGNSRTIKTWQEIQESLKSDETLVELKRFQYVSLEDFLYNRKPIVDSVFYVAFMLTSSDKAPRFVNIPEGNNLEHRYFSYYRNAITAGVQTDILYAKYWEPIQKSATRSGKIYFVPDGIFNLLNLNTIRNPVTKKFIIDETNLHFLTSSAELSSSKTSGPEKTALLIGSPSFNTNVPAGDITRKRERGVFDLVREDFEPLPGTEKEIKEIQKVLNEKLWNTKTYLFAEATEEVVKASVSPAIIHIATHGFFFDDESASVNPMLKSGLILAGVNNDSGTRREDGILTSQEISTLELAGTNLVVLSACETGLGELRSDEGVYGLQRAFTLAGAKQVIMSLWKVDDLITQELMLDFYKAWMSSGDIYSSFREAQIKLRNNYPLPQHWGAFVLMGITTKSAKDTAATNQTYPLVETAPKSLSLPKAVKVNQFLSIDKLNGKRTVYSIGDRVLVKYISSGKYIFQVEGQIRDIYASSISVGTDEVPINNILSFTLYDRKKANRIRALELALAISAGLATPIVGISLISVDIAVIIIDAINQAKKVRIFTDYQFASE